MRTGHLASALLSRGHEVIWWASTFSHQRRKRRTESDCRISLNDRYALMLVEAGVYRVNVSWARYAHHFRLARRWLRVARTQEPPDILVVAMPTIEWAVAAAWYGRAHRIPFVVDIRDLWPDVWVHKAPDSVRRLVHWTTWPWRVATRWALRRATSIVAVSDGYLQWGRRLSGRRTTSFDAMFPIGCASPPSTLTSESQDHGSKQPQIVCVFVGSFGRSYDLETVCSAGRRLWEQGDRRIRFVLIGDGERAEIVRRMAATLPSVTLTGWLGADEVAEHLRQADIALVPCVSLPNTVPNKFFECLSAGLPLVSSLEGEVERMIANLNLGLSYRAGDVTQLCECLTRLARDPELRGAQAQAARNAAARLHVDKIYSAYSEHLETLVETWLTKR